MRVLGLLWVGFVVVACGGSETVMQPAAASGGAAGSASVAGGAAGSAPVTGGTAGSAPVAGGAGAAGAIGGGNDGGSETGPAPDTCGGLACSTCPTNAMSLIPYDLCTSSSSCRSVTDCAAQLPSLCNMTLGTFYYEFHRVACLGGACAYVPAGAGCIDGTGCDACPASKTACAFKPSGLECAKCCEQAGGIDPEDYAPQFQACACGSGGPCTASCATSPLCGGTGAETADCVNCVAGTLRDGGACIASARFQASCIHGDTLRCSRVARCLATCPL